jgi:pimeloyl-ACP methyl ester carboxylesterase
MVTTLNAPFEADQSFLSLDSGKIAIFRHGSGRPVLLVHSVNAAACAAEVKPLFQHFSQSRQAWALDLPGYGLSERKAMAYTVRMMTDAVIACAQQAYAQAGNVPIDALALSLSSEFLARAAAEHPHLFGRLIMVSPTGFRGMGSLREPAGSTRYMAWLDRALRGPGWGGAVFRGLTRPSVIRYFLKRTWGSDSIDEELWAYDTRTTRQPNAEHAPLSFLSGRLFSKDIHTLYDQLDVPILITHGTRGDFTDYRGLTLFAHKRDWQICVFQDTGALHFFEKPAEFKAIADRFLHHDNEHANDRSHR